ncbi:class I SAM-dependent methyltransferase [Candidatus Methylacidiphilum fumarolicum]|uniref:SAM-dependent methyltransferase n=2 Tax=Candidatus Methylacidiphilum fumarolicum TaxID=591154 RepID=I0K0A2_METFB|nr:class I SAM-dependent methyltransferase [Candidatus Methylacidiphilum fumarolicum]MBW6415100.1 class I SAM-dependent methyltransferase [Candidatus Methylacidiphilum fumarolicum]TFE65735.1 SAM-dependent methyltransferase [Candidatus Methylacidiphilum fumarolicum]TFE71186.1 class I SAM-dependent methyltransferase [Candidatus Methylacidiphilum fumarolicum]TFE72094.1 class I SAM-dependent methyltransferase [Candidatus Methylacidiphilum fumarolicum]TFE74070.1 SAM-dependent methyltransferase [Can
MNTISNSDTESHFDFASFSRAVLNQFESTPFPFEDEKVLSDQSWKIIPPNWLNAIGRPGKPFYDKGKFLVAGCGTGNEAFNIARAFPNLTVVAFDISQRAIETAIKWQKASGIQNVHFVQEDLMNPNLSHSLGSDFDWISCHEVLSFVYDPQAALHHLASCLSPDGCIYIGVKGTFHPTVRLAPAISLFSLNLNNPEQLKRTRDVLSACDNLMGIPIDKGIGAQPESYLKTHVFGVHHDCFPLHTWIEIIHNSGLQYINSLYTSMSFLQLQDNRFFDILTELDLPTLHSLIDHCNPSFFHMIIASKPRKMPPFAPADRNEFLHWRPLVDLWDRTKIQAVHPPYNQVLEVTFDIPGLYRQLPLKLSSYLIEFLRRSDGSRPVSQIVAEIGVDVKPGELFPALARFYFSSLLNFLPPL